MEREARFYSAGIALAANVHLPARLAPGERRPGIVLAGGLGSIKEMVLPDLARAFTAAGYVVLRFDYRGFGQSEGTRFRLIPLEQVEDIRNAITFLGLQPEVDRERIGLYGTSFGGAHVVTAAALDRRARCVIAAVPVGNGERWLQSLRRNWEWVELTRRLDADREQRVLTGRSEMVASSEVMVPDPESAAWAAEILRAMPQRTYTLPLESADAIREYRPEECAAQLGECPLLVVQVADDLLVPNTLTEDLYARASGPKKLVTLRGPMHHAIYRGDAFTQVTGHALRWLGCHLPVSP